MELELKWLLPAVGFRYIFYDDNEFLYGLEHKYRLNWSVYYVWFYVYYPGYYESYLLRWTRYIIIDNIIIDISHLPIYGFRGFTFTYFGTYEENKKGLF